jgi:CDGSH-type Zn-finger protein
MHRRRVIDPHPWRTLLTAVRVIPLPDGPLEVTGPVEVARPGGEPIGPPASPTYLCRCGRSANKPFCDGSHARTGWTEKQA